MCQIKIARLWLYMFLSKATLQNTERRYEFTNILYISCFLQNFCYIITVISLTSARFFSFYISLSFVLMLTRWEPHLLTNLYKCMSRKLLNDKNSIYMQSWYWTHWNVMSDIWRRYITKETKILLIFLWFYVKQLTVNWNFDCFVC